MELTETNYFPTLEKSEKASVGIFFSRGNLKLSAIPAKIHAV